MKYMVTVHPINEDMASPTVSGLSVRPLYQQEVDGDAFDLGAFVRAVNVKKRVRAPRKKGEA